MQMRTVASMQAIRTTTMKENFIKGFPEQKAASCKIYIWLIKRHTIFYCVEKTPNLSTGVMPSRQKKAICCWFSCMRVYLQEDGCPLVKVKNIYEECPTK